MLAQRVETYLLNFLVGKFLERHGVVVGDMVKARLLDKHVKPLKPGNSRRGGELKSPAHVFLIPLIRIFER